MQNKNKEYCSVLEVNLSAMIYNLNYFRSLLKPETRVLIMVKAFSYGSGLTEVANMLKSENVDYLGVAAISEGVELRNAGLDMPVIVMNPGFCSFDDVIDYRLEPEICSFSSLDCFEEVLKRRKIKNYPIHVKLDTGMHRLGFEEKDIDVLIERIENNECFYIKSVFSHLAGADEEQHDEFTSMQIGRFSRWSDCIRSRFSYPIIRHILNSAGIERFPEAQFEMVRLGIGLYGVSAIHQSKVRNISTLKTIILQIREVSEGDTVGYGRKAQFDCTTRIGVIAIGYADGFSRRLDNGRGKVLVNGKLVPVVGNICMDMSMIDLTGVEADEGDSVIVFGEDYSIEKIAKQLDTIPYEVLTSVSRRVKRIFYE